MSEEKKNMIKQTVENLKHLDEESLKIMKSNSEVLKARDALEKEKEKEKRHEEVDPDHCQVGPGAALPAL